MTSLHENEARHPAGAASKGLTRNGKKILSKFFLWNSYGYAVFYDLKIRHAWDFGGLVLV